jgi:hypothetical protein
MDRSGAGLHRFVPPDCLPERKKKGELNRHAKGK